MDQQFGNEAEEEVLVESHGEAEVGPVVSELQGFKSVALEINLSIEVLFVENLHGNLALAAVGGTVMLVVEMKVVLDGATSILGLLVLARRNGRSHGPEGHQDGDGREDSKEDSGVETTTDLASQVPRNKQQQRVKQDVRETIAACSVCGDGGIFDSRVLKE